MSKLGCICGHIIADNTDSIPYKGNLLKDEDSERFWDAAAAGLAALVGAVKSGRREGWIDQHFLSGYPRNLNDEAVISDFLSGLWMKYSVTVYECESCGRIKVQEGTTSNQFRSYAPEDSVAHNVLRSEYKDVGDG